MGPGEHRVFRVKVPMLASNLEQELCCTTSPDYAADVLKSLLACNDERLVYVKVELGVELNP